MPDTLIGTASVQLPWGAWHGDSWEALRVPEGWRIRELPMTDAQALSDAEIGLALDAPVDASALHVLAAGKRRVAIAIDDITRPTQTEPLVRLLVDRLTGSGIAEGNITVVVATGAHRRATARDLELKVGRELLGRVRVVSHDPARDLVPTGVSLAGVPVSINREFAAADLRIGVSAVMPHPFAGFGGGGKIVVPGLADLDVLTRTHKMALMGFRGGSSLEGNTFRAEMEQAVRQIGLHWTIGVVVNSRRETAFVAAGDLVGAHRAAAAVAQQVGATAAPLDPLDALILNGYPKDGELLQLESALVGLRSGLLQWLAPAAPVILTGATPGGRGHHDLFGPGGRLWRVPSPKVFLGGRRLWVFASGVPHEEMRTVFHATCPAYPEWGSLVADLQPQLPAEATIGVIPCGPLQLAREHSPVLSRPIEKGKIHA